MKKLIIHIGSPKAGSTALQTWLLKNRSYLNENNVDYQNFEQNETDWRIHRGLTGGSIWTPIYPKVDGTLELNQSQVTMLGQILNTAREQLENFDTLIVSNEFLYFIATEDFFWKSLLKLSTENKIDISLIFYLRDPFKFLFSWYSESVKRGFTLLKFSEYIKQDIQIFDSVYFDLPQILGAANEFNIDFDLFCTSEQLRDVPMHFLEHIGIRPNGSNLSIANLGLNSVEIDFFRGVHSISRELGLILCYEKTDTYLNALYSQKSGSKVIPTIDLSSAAFIREKLNYLRQCLWDVHPSLKNLDYQIPSDLKITTEEDLKHDNSELLFQLGVSVARSFKGGYLRSHLKE